jgi:hypothetical protein
VELLIIVFPPLRCDILAEMSTTLSTLDQNN